MPPAASVSDIHTLPTPAPMLSSLRCWQHQGEPGSCRRGRTAPRVDGTETLVHGTER